MKPAPSLDSRPDRPNPGARRVFRAAGMLFLSVLAAAPLRSADPLPYAPDNIVSPGHAFDPTRPAPPWDALLQELQAKGAIRARFTENRYLPFKKVPVVFKGEIRLSPDRGLSLHYTEPEERTLVVDDQGVLMRDPSGRTRELPADPRALAATSALLHVMRFNFTELTRTFSTYATGQRELWHLAFEPRDDALARNLSRLVVTGENDQVRRIQMRKSSMQSIEILVSDVEEGASFKPDELSKYFR